MHINRRSVRSELMLLVSLVCLSGIAATGFFGDIVSSLTPDGNPQFNLAEFDCQCFRVMASPTFKCPQVSVVLLGRFDL